MIFRPLKFHIVYQVGAIGARSWVREPVAELLFSAMGVSSITTASGVELAFDPMQMSVLQFTGSFDKTGAEIYHGHALIDEAGAAWEVVFAQGNFYFHKDEQMLPLTEDMCMKLTIVGDALQNAPMLVPENTPELLDKAKERAKLPVVNLRQRN